jgi:hypothetical protein
MAAPAGPVPVVTGAVAWLGGQAGEQPGRSGRLYPGGLCWFAAGC